MGNLLSHNLAVNALSVKSFSNLYKGLQILLNRYKYIVLPWNLETNAGRIELKSLIDKIPSFIRGVLTTITYALYVHVDDIVGQNTTSITVPSMSASAPQAIIAQTNTQQDISQNNTPKSEIISEAMTDFSWSGNSFSEDNEEKLLDEIEALQKESEARQNNYINARDELSIKNNQISNLRIQLNSLQTQLNQKQIELNNVSSQLSSKIIEINSINNQLTQKNNEYNILSNKSFSEIRELQNQLKNQQSCLNRRIREEERKFEKARDKMDKLLSNPYCSAAMFSKDSIRFRLNWFTGTLTVYNNWSLNNHNYDAILDHKEYQKYTII